MERARHAGSSLIDWIGDEGRRRIGSSSCAVVGCGALGSASSNLLVRLGFREVKIIDRDFVEFSNLERQTLFDESDAQMMKPKALAARDRLAPVNSDVEVVGIVQHFGPDNAENLLSDVDIVIDGVDNMETRYLVNEVCVKKAIPWVHGACLSSTGMLFGIVPGGPCFRCLYPSPPAAGRIPTCETEGILPSVPQVVGALQAQEAVKIVCGKENTRRGMLKMDLDECTYEILLVEKSAGCPTCAGHHYEYLEGGAAAFSGTLCSRNAVHICPGSGTGLDLESLRRRLSKAGEVAYKGYLLSFKTGENELVVFPDGRAIVKGTQDTRVARSLYAKYVGN